MDFVQIVRIPPDGVDLFQTYESRVLPLLPKYGGRLVRRLCSADGCVEVHTLWFPSPDALDRYRADPERVAAQPMLEASGATAELIEMSDVG